MSDGKSEASKISENGYEEKKRTIKQFFIECLHACHFDIKHPAFIRYERELEQLALAEGYKRAMGEVKGKIKQEYDDVASLTVAELEDTTVEQRQEYLNFLSRLLTLLEKKIKEV